MKNHTVAPAYNQLFPFPKSEVLDTRDKRAEGRFYTCENPFSHEAFHDWASRARLPRAVVLEPFAGANNLIKMMKDVNLCRSFSAFDILPGDSDVQQRDTLADFPTGFDVCVTNPPWLARNSAVRRGLPYPQTSYDNLYKYCLAICLRHCGYVAALVPESFICSGNFLSRLVAFISLNHKMFADTDHPTGLALFEPSAKKSAMIYAGKQQLDTLAELHEHCPPRVYNKRIVFNAPDGNVGFIALDNNHRPSIRFCHAEELGDYLIKHSCRAITKIKIPGKPDIRGYNRFIDEFRDKTGDVVLTAYRGLRRDGFYRRRMDYGLARDIIGYVGF